MKFCGGCGQPLARQCPACDQTAAPNARFCGHCGALLETAAESSEAERRQLTVMFCDLVSSTEMSGRLDPEELRELINLYHESVGAIVTKHEGTVAQYLGDGMLVYFGHPVAREDDAFRAVTAGTEIVAAIKDLEHRDLTEVLRVRVGIHTGMVVIGEVGQGRLSAQLAHGVVPNIAARIQSEAAPNQLLISGTTYRLVRERVDARKLGFQELRGVERAMELVQVSSIRSTDATRLEVRAETPFIGRARELETAQLLHRLSMGGQGQMLTIRGEPGLGKTRLLHELRGDTRSRWLVCRCSAALTDRPLAPILAMLTDLTSDFADDPIGFKNWMMQHHSTLNDADALIRHQLGYDVHPDEIPPSANQQRVRTIRVLTDLLIGLARVEPTVLVIEDLHWSDPSTLEVLQQLATKITRSSLFVVLTARNEFHPPWDTGAQQTQMELSRLSRDESQQLVQTWASTHLDAHARATLIERADGVPLFLEEIVREHQTGAEQKTNVSTVPFSCLDSITARLDALGKAKETAQLAALLGRRFFLHQLLAVSPLPNEAVTAHLSALVETGILRQRLEEDETMFVFKHALVQDAAYESQLRRERVRLHKVVIHAIESGDMESTADLTAWHYLGAGELEKAITHYEAAADAAFGQWALSESIALYRKALDALTDLDATPDRDRLELMLLNKIAVPIQAYENYTAPELFDAVRRKLELIGTMETSDRFDALLGVWGVYGSAGNRTHTESLAEELLQSSGESNDLSKIQIANETVGYTRLLQGRLRDALEHFSVAHETGDAGQPQALLWFAWANAFLGKQRAADALLNDASELADRSASPLLKSHIFSYLNLIRQNLETEPEVVLDLAQQMQQLTREHEMEIWYRYFEMQAAWATALTGDELGVAEMQEAMVHAYPSDLSLRGHSIISLVEILLHYNRFEEAHAQLDEADAFFARNVASFSQPDSYRLRGICYAKAGLQNESREFFDRSIQLSRQHGNKLFELKARRDRLVQLGDSEVERQELARLYNSMQESHEVPAVRKVGQMLK